MPAPVVVLQLWGVPLRALPRAVAHVAADRLALRAVPGLRFSRSLGTGAGRSFGPGDADLRRWALLTVWADETAAAAFESGPLVARWRRFADEEWTARLRPLAVRGRWGGREPFGRPVPGPHTGPVAALTRARLAPGGALRFWRAVPPVAADLHRAPGLLLGLGIGEAPLGWQGTFTLWRDQTALTGFAYGRAAHAAVVARTGHERWYAEELFARFAVEAARGTVRGVDPLAAPAGR